MHRRILGVCTALAAFLAMAIVPAIASAGPELTHPTGSTVLPGTKITAIAEGNTLLKNTAGETQVTCQAAEDHTWLTGTVVKNDGNTIEGTIERAAFQGNQERTHEGQALKTLCQSPLLGATQVLIPGLTSGGGTTHWCVKTTLGHNFEVQPDGCGTPPAGHQFTFILTGNLTCRYVRSANITGTFTTTHPGTMKVAPDPVFNLEQPSSIFCPGSGVLSNFAFNLYTDGGTLSESTTTPVAISEKK